MWEVESKFIIFVNMFMVRVVDKNIRVCVMILSIFWIIRNLVMYRRICKL